eukprot:13634212-Heterocapsa_arctica.AAC.1
MSRSRGGGKSEWQTGREGEAQGQGKGKGEGTQPNHGAMHFSLWLFDHLLGLYTLVLHIPVSDHTSSYCGPNYTIHKFRNGAKHFSLWVKK